jgi:hypothetical protein
MNDEVRMWKEVVMTNLKTLFKACLRGLAINNEIRQLTSVPRIEPTSGKVRNRTANHSTGTFRSIFIIVPKMENWDSSVE